MTNIGLRHSVWRGPKDGRREGEKREQRFHCPQRVRERGRRERGGIACRLMPRVREQRSESEARERAAV